MKTNLNDLFSKFSEVKYICSYPYRKQIPRLFCHDGFSLSVQVGETMYCKPRNNSGPYFECEVGFPSDIPELIMEYCEDPETPTNTVYGYVPVSLVEQLIDLHGGIKE